MWYFELVKRLTAEELDARVLRLEELKAEEERLRAELREQINKILEVRKAPVKNQDYLIKGKRAIERGFKAMSPFAKNFLRVAKDGQSVILRGFLSLMIV